MDENDVESYNLSIVEDPIHANLLFLGTDDGLYVSLNAGDSWTKWTAGFPTVSTKDLVIQPREHDLVIGTFGRAAWVLDDIRPLRAMASGTVLDKTLVLFDPPTAYQAAYQQPTEADLVVMHCIMVRINPEAQQISYYVNRPVEKQQVEETVRQKEKRKRKR